jgi:hypothetical protein
MTASTSKNWSSLVRVPSWTCSEPSVIAGPSSASGGQGSVPRARVDVDAADQAGRLADAALTAAENYAGEPERRMSAQITPATMRATTMSREWSRDRRFSSPSASTIVTWPRLR